MNSLNNLLKSIAENPIIILSGFALGVIGIVLAIIFYINGRRYKSPRFEVVSKTVIENLKASLDGLEVRFNDIPQARITISRIAFWNAGTETITASDLTEISPIQISVSSGAKVLDAKVIHETDRTNLFRIKEVIRPVQDSDATAIIITFDYIDRNEGCIFQIVHTGESSHKILVEGKLKGSKPIRRLENPVYHLRWAFPGPLKILATSPIYNWFGVIFSLVISIAGIIIPLLYPNYWYAVFLIPVGAIETWAMYSGYSVEQLPKSLEILDK